MFFRILPSIYDGPLRSCWQALVMFQQVLTLADKSGTISMTTEALHYRTGIPIPTIEAGMSFLVHENHLNKTDRGWEITRPQNYRNGKTPLEKRERWREQKAAQRKAKNLTLQTA